MSERRSLVEGIKPAAPPVNSAKEKEFVYGDKPSTPASKQPADPQNLAPLLSRTPISTRIRTEFADALKRASLERQLNKVQPNTLQDILEEAIEPWLRNNGYLK